MKKILLVATVQSHICQFHRPLAEMLRTLGDVEIHVAARDNLKEKNGLKLDFADCVFDVPFSRSPKSADNIKAYSQLKRIIADNHYDVIHCNTPMGGIVARLAALQARKNGTKVFYTAHGFHFYRGASKLNWLIYYPIEKLFSRITDCQITINQEDFQLASQKFHCPVEHIHGVGVDPERYHAIPNEERWALKEKLRLSQDKRYILCVGELLPNKNQAMVIKAMKRVVQKHPEAMLLLAGNGSEHQNLVQLTDTLQLQEQVRFLGYVTNLQEYQQISEIAVSCSKREGLPLNLIEAMLTENALLATRNRGHDELIVDGENGYLVDSGDVEYLAEKLLLLLEDPTLSRKLGIAGHAVGMNYAKGRVQAELKNIYLKYQDE